MSSSDEWNRIQRKKEQNYIDIGQSKIKTRTETSWDKINNIQLTQKSSK